MERTKCKRQKGERKKRKKKKVCNMNLSLSCKSHLKMGEVWGGILLMQEYWYCVIDNHTLFFFHFTL